MRAPSDRGDPRLSTILAAVATSEKSRIRRFLGGVEEAYRTWRGGDREQARTILRNALVSREEILARIAASLEAAFLRPVRVLNRDGAGFVFQAGDPLGEDLAVKVFLHALETPADLDSFEEAARSIAAAAGEWSTPIRALGLAGPFFYVIRPFVPGAPVLGCPGIREHGDLEKLLLIRRIAAAVDTLGASGLPGELKETRVLVDRVGTPHLIDHGLLADCLRRIGRVESPWTLSWTRGDDAPWENADVRALVRILDGLVSSSATRGGRRAAASPAIQELLDEFGGSASRSSVTLEALISRIDEILIETMAHAAPRLDPDETTEFEAAADEDAFDLCPETVDRLADAIAGASGERFEGLQCIDHGGMGAIFLARDKSLGVLRAIKAARIRSFSRETRDEVMRLARLRHKSIVTVHELVTSDEVSFFVMDYLPGTDLERLVAAARSVEGEEASPVFSHREAATLLRDVARAVEYLHGQAPPVVHNDIKPRNIQVVDLEGSVENDADPKGAKATSKSHLPRRWEPILLDFGLAQRLGERQTTFGTRGWTPPERRSPGSSRLSADSASDVWNLGALLYFLLTNGESVRLLEPEKGEGQKPLPGESPPPPSLRRLGVPRALVRTASRCLADDPDERPTAREVADRLDQYLAGTRPSRLVLALSCCALVMAALTYLVFGPKPALGPEPRDCRIGKNLFGVGRAGVAVADASQNRVALLERSDAGDLVVESFISLDRPPLAMAVLTPEKGKTDDLVTADGSDLVVWSNRGDGRFEEASRVRGCIGGEAVMLLSGAFFASDGAPDLAVADPDGVELFEYAGEHRLERRVSSFQRNLLLLCTADFDPEGTREDLVAAVAGDDPELRALVRAREFTYDPERATRIQWRPDALVAADFDRDGVDEIVIAAGDEVHLFRWDGRLRGFVRPLAILPARATALGAVDLSGGSEASVVAIHPLGTGGYFTVLRNRPGGPAASLLLELNRFRVPQDIEPRLLAAGAFGDEEAAALVLVGSGRGVLLREENLGALQLPPLLQPSDLALGDLDGRGGPDLIASIGGIDAVATLLGGDDGFRAPRYYRVGNVPRSLLVGDLDGDGGLDLATQNLLSRDLSVLWGSGDGAYEEGTPIRFDRAPIRGAEPRGFTAADVDGNGFLDLVVALRNNRPREPGWVDVVYGLPHREIRRAEPISVGVAPRSIVAADLDRDGRTDLVVACEGSRGHSAGEVRILRNVGGGTFEDQRIPSTPDTGEPEHVVVEDVTADGVADLIVSCESRVVVLAGKGDWEFEAFGTRPDQVIGLGHDPKSDPEKVLALDLDGDRDPDLVVCDEQVRGGRVFVLKNLDGSGFQIVSALSVAAPQAAVLVDRGPLRGHLAVLSRSRSEILLFPRRRDGFFAEAPARTIRLSGPTAAER